MDTKLAAGERYVAITREDFEMWLDKTKSALSAKKWQPLPNRVGGYQIYLSDAVAIHLSTSLASDDQVRALGEGAMRMRLVSVKSGRVLNKKATGKDYFQRTKNWATTLLKGAKDLKAAYDKSSEFYEQLASIEDPEQYRKDWIAKITESGAASSNDFVKDLLIRLEGGSLLSKKQEDALSKALERYVAPKSGGFEQKFGPNTTKFLDKFGDLDTKGQLEVLRDIYVLIKRNESVLSSYEMLSSYYDSGASEGSDGDLLSMHLVLLDKVESIAKHLKSGKFIFNEMGSLIDLIGPTLSVGLNQIMRRM